MRKKPWKTAMLAMACALLWPMPPGTCADLSLQDAIDLALQKNVALRITQKGEEQADATLREAKGNKGFSVSASGGFSANKQNSEEFSTGVSAGVSARLPIYSGGRLESAIESGEIGVKAAELTTARERENLRLSVITAYYTALESRKTIQVKQEAVDNYEAHLTNVQQLYSAGSKARMDVLRSSVELSDARQELIRAQNAYEVNLADLRNILNVDRNEPLNLTDDVVYTSFSRELPYCLGYAAQNRKDLQVDAYTLEQRELAIKIAEANRRPAVDLSVGTDWDGSISPDNSSTHAFNAGISASWNIFDSGVTQAQIDSAKANRDIAQLTLDKDRNQVDFDVRQAYYNMREAEKRLNSTQDAVDQAKEDYFIAREKYRVGEGIMLDVLDAQMALSNAEMNYISAKYDYARYRAAVENAMGMELTEEELKAAGVTPASAALDQREENLPMEWEISQARERAADEAMALAEEMAGTSEGFPDESEEPTEEDMAAMGEEYLAGGLEESGEEQE